MTVARVNSTYRSLLKRQIDVGGRRPRGLTCRSAMGGFTLLELLVVLAIAALVLTVTPPLLTGTLSGMQLKGSARELVAALRYARTEAIGKRQANVLALDLDELTYTVGGRDKVYRLPDETEVKMVTASSEMLGENQGAIRFYPDGSSTGGRITLVKRDNRYQVDVDWLTGRVSIRD